VPQSSNPKQHDLPEFKTKEVDKTPDASSKDTTKRNKTYQVGLCKKH